MGRATVHGPAPPNHPHVKVEHARRVRQCGNHLAFDRDSVLVDLLVECFAEADDVCTGFIACRLFGLVVVKPKPHPVEEMKASPINQATAGGVVLGPEEDRGGKDAMETLDDSAIMAAVLGQAEEVEHLGGAFETDDPASLLDGERRYPDGNEAVLAERAGQIRMAGDVEKEFAIPPRVSKLGPWWPAERNAAEDEGSGIVGELSLAVVAFFSDKGDGFELPEPELREECEKVAR